MTRCRSKTGKWFAWWLHVCWSRPPKCKPSPEQCRLCVCTCKSIVPSRSLSWWLLNARWPRRWSWADFLGPSTPWIGFWCKEFDCFHTGWRVCGWSIRRNLLVCRFLWVSFTARRTESSKSKAWAWPFPPIGTFLTFRHAIGCTWFLWGSEFNRWFFRWLSHLEWSLLRCNLGRCRQSCYWLFSCTGRWLQSFPSH